MIEPLSALALALLNALIAVVPLRVPEVSPRGNVSVTEPVSVEAGEIVEP